MAATLSNHFRYMVATKKIDFANDVFLGILLDDSFVFDPKTHATLADITANQLATGYGYTQNNKQLMGVSVAEDDSIDRCTIVWDDPTWTASGGAIGPLQSMAIVDDTTTDDTVVGCITNDLVVTVPDGKPFTVTDIEVRI